MSIPHMTREVWEQIRDQQPLTEPAEVWGCWRLDVVKVLYNIGEQWSLVAMHKDPPPPPPDQGRMDPAAWRRISGGELIEDYNVIERGATRSQVHHLRGRPGVAMPVVVQELTQKAEAPPPTGRDSKTA